jgi:hypothetical protein
LIDRFDWTATAIGPIEDWAPEMKAVLAFVLRSPTPIVTLWGETGVMIYNDAYRAFAGNRHPALLGSNVLEGWHEVADFNANVLQKVYREGARSPIAIRSLRWFGTGRRASCGLTSNIRRPPMRRVAFSV